MLSKLKTLFLGTATRIVVFASVGVLFVAGSFNSSGTYRGRAYGASVEPVLLAIGVAFLILAWLTYKKWSSTKT